MSFVSEASTFGQAQLGLFRYWYERMPYTAFDPAMGVGQQSVINIQNVSNNVSNAIAIVNNLAATPQPGVALTVNGPKAARTEQLAGFPSGLTPIMSGSEDGERSTGLLIVSTTNASGAALTTPMQINYMAAIKHLTVADKLKLGMSLSEAETALQKKYNLFNQGFRPLPIRSMLERVFYSQITQEEFQTVVLPSVGAAGVPIGPFSPNPNEVLVLHSIAASIPEDAVGNLVQLTINRDNDKPRGVILLDNAPGLGTPWPVWMTAVESFSFRVNALTTTSNVVLRLGWYRVRLSLVLQVMFGMNPTLPKQEADLPNQVAAGVVV